MAGDGDGIGIFCTGVWDLLCGGQDWGKGVRKAGDPPSSIPVLINERYKIKHNFLIS